MRYHYKGNQQNNKPSMVFSNDKIKARSIIVIDENWEKLGVMYRQLALDLAKEKGLDLVQISYDRDKMISTAKLLDLWKHLYDKKKKEKDKKKQQTKWTKEVRLSYSTWDNDIARKIQKVWELLQEWYTMKILLQVKWRERNFMDKAVIKIQAIQKELEEFGRPQFSYPKQERKWYYILIAPSKTKQQNKKSSN